MTMRTSVESIDMLSVRYHWREAYSVTQGQCVNQPAYVHSNIIWLFINFILVNKRV